MESENIVNNVFMHDAVPTWSGFLYQGRIAVYLAVKKIIELSEAEIEKCALEMEKCEDIAIVYIDGKNRKYQSIHQVKNEKYGTLGAYKDPLVQLMLEKGFCKKYNYGNPAACLHISKEISVQNQSLKKFVKKNATDWKDDILKFYNELRKIYNSFVESGDLLSRLLTIMEANSKTIGINREEFKKKYLELKKMCIVALDDIDNIKTIDGEKIKDALGDFIEYLSEKLYATEVSDDVEIYEYKEGKSYCSGSEIFEEIVALIKEYKGNNCGLTEAQFNYIADIMINFVEKKILERHKNMQEKKAASCKIMLSEFKSLLDSEIENDEKEANVLALKRLYNDYLENYCNICQDLSKKDCCDISCKLKQSDYIKGILEKEEFIRFCYNLNPECDKKINDRECLSNLLNRDGMLESVFPSIKEITEDKFIEKEDKIHLKVRNQDKIAFLTAISSKYDFLAVKNIENAMEIHPELIETIFDADQLVTTRLSKDSSAWDSSCIRVRLNDFTDENAEVNNNEHSIYVAKRPEFVEAAEFIKSMEKEV